MRKSGILLHISSLPSDYGIGKMGSAAYAFADFLVDAGVQVWQILPLSPTSYGDSPYQSFSVYAGNPYFIDYEQLEQEGLLTRVDYAGLIWDEDPRRVDYAHIYQYCYDVLHKAYTRFDQSDADYQSFCRQQEAWLPEYALFMALKNANGGKPWYLWENPLAMHEPDAIATAKKLYQDDIAFYCVMQYWFHKQWYKLKHYCNKRGITIVGDIPIYVAYDSVEVWSQPELFQLDDDHVPTAVAGCPPDVFSPSGQLWGNPLYDWNYHKETNYAWWVQRLARAATLYDTVRIDHFRGFESYYKIPYGMKDAKIGKWMPGPGAELFRTVKEKLGAISIIAEDLGFVTPEVRQLLSDCGYPGMKVLQFAFDDDPASTYLPQNYTTPNCVAYTGTHDNMTLRGWVSASPSKTIAFAKRYLHCRNASDLPMAMLRLTWNSIAELAVAQMQDFLDSGPEGRMNTPSTTGGNWQYRTVASDFTPRLAKRIYSLNELSNRLPAKTAPKPLQRRAKSVRTAEKKSRGEQ
mgnify:FL=1